ncbi:Glyoxalase/bleomycin resistance protein/dioxygenase [Kribbella flavida DSM 17836]|uniref:Glyoxalase/bleomycin resistance protein/dioxygenase n=1 Tax=Kribbella flavida (strain DSM 17836 / JCM 10339 / NBRC 14399) TaxID=479435 RepID=D2PNA2_KRIFD|nr:VOC family protein [Kribbella flavida]ADB34586.1 Glyoxalase/bleomycin resistance protein/dioxygenase [Kribbella flavida DSM 17836]
MTDPQPTPADQPATNSLDELEVITFFVEDVAACKDFYTGVLGLDVVYEDADSAVLKLRNLMINLLTVDNAPAVIQPAAVGTPTCGARALHTIRVDDVDAAAAELRGHGIALLNGPMDRPWGRRTAAFADPAGNLWEIAQLID